MSSSPSFQPLVRKDSIQRCYGSPSPSPLLGRRIVRKGNIKPTTKSRQITTPLRWLTNASALVSTFFFAGTIFGWAPLKLVLVREGQYSEVCDDTPASSRGVEHEPCAAQEDKFNLIFTLAQFFLSFASLPVGFFLDYSSKTLHYTMAAIFQVGGLVLFGISDTQQSRNFFVLSYSLMALGGCMTILGAFPASFLLPDHQAGILAAVSCLFDASSIIFAVFSPLNTWDEDVFSRKHMFVVFAVLAIVVYGILVYCWRRLELSNWTQVVEEEEENSRMIKQNEIAVAAEKEDTTSSLNSGRLHLERIHRLGMHGRPLIWQLASFDFMLVVIFSSVHMLRCNFYIETVNELLASIGDDDAKYANIFSFVLPGGIVFVPLIEATVRSFGVVNTLHFTNILGALFGALLLVPSLYVQTFNFALFACFRAYLYATLNTFIAVTFGVTTMGRVIGSTFTTAAVVTLLQYPAAAMAEVRHHSNFPVVNIMMLAACAVPTVLALIYSYRISSDHSRNGEGVPLLIREKGSRGLELEGTGKI